MHATRSSGFPLYHIFQSNINSLMSCPLKISNFVFVTRFSLLYFNFIYWNSKKNGSCFYKVLYEIVFDIKKKERRLFAGLPVVYAVDCTCCCLCCWLYALLSMLLIVQNYIQLIVQNYHLSEQYWTYIRNIFRLKLMIFSKVTKYLLFTVLVSTFRYITELKLEDVI